MVLTQVAYAHYCPFFTLRDGLYLALESIVHETVVLRDLQADIHMRNINLFDCKEAMLKSYELPKGPFFGIPRTEIVFVSHAETFQELLEDTVQDLELPRTLQFHFTYKKRPSSGAVDICYYDQQISDILYSVLAEGFAHMEQKLKEIIHTVRCAEKGKESVLVRYWHRREPLLRSIEWERALEATWCIPQERKGLLVHERTFSRRCQRAE